MDTRFESGWQIVCRGSPALHAMRRRVVHDVAARSHLSDAAGRTLRREDRWDEAMAGALCHLLSDPDNGISGVHLVAASPHAVEAVQQAADRAGLSAQPADVSEGRRPRTVVIRRERLPLNRSAAK